MDVAVPPTSLLPHMSTPSCVATQLLLCVVHTWEECLLIEAALHYICSPVVAPVCLLLGRAALLGKETTWASCLACPPSSRHLHFLYSHQHRITVFLSSVPNTLCLPSAPLTPSFDTLLYSSCAHERQSCANARRQRGNAAWWHMVCSCSTLVTCLAGRGPAIGHSNSWGPVGATGLQEQQAAAHRPPSSADSSLPCATHTRTTVEQATDYEHCHPRLPCIIISKTGISAQCPAARPHCCCSRRRHQQAYE